MGRPPNQLGPNCSTFKRSRLYLSELIESHPAWKNHRNFAYNQRLVSDEFALAEELARAAGKCADILERVEGNQWEKYRKLNQDQIKGALMLVSAWEDRWK